MPRVIGTVRSNRAARSTFLAFVRVEAEYGILTTGGSVYRENVQLTSGREGLLVSAKPRYLERSNVRSVAPVPAPAVERQNVSVARRVTKNTLQRECKGQGAVRL